MSFSQRGIEARVTGVADFGPARREIAQFETLVRNMVRAIEHMEAHPDIGIEQATQQLRAMGVMAGRTTAEMRENLRSIKLAIQQGFDPRAIQPFVAAQEQLVRLTKQLEADEKRAVQLDAEQLAAARRLNDQLDQEVELRAVARRAVQESIAAAKEIVRQQRLVNDEVARQAMLAQQAARAAAAQQANVPAAAGFAKLQTAQDAARARAALAPLAVDLNTVSRNASKANQTLAETGAALAKTGAAARSASSDFQAIKSDVDALAYRMRLLGVGMSATITLPLVGIGRTVLTVGSNFEDAFTNVLKVVEGTEEQLAGLEQDIRDMAQVVPVSASSIAEIAALGGALGVARDELADFTDVAVRMGVSTNLAADQAADAMARFTNITQTAQTAENFERIGATVVDLGNKSAATEREIFTMALRLAAAGTQIGLTNEQILGMATTLASLGIRAEAGGSSFSKVMLTIANAVSNGGDALEQFAAISQMSTEQFRQTFEENAIAAIAAFLGGLNQIREGGENVFPILKELELNDIRVRDAALRAANAYQLFARDQRIASEAMQEGNALLVESERRFGTVSSQWQLVKNDAAELAITLFQELRPGLLVVFDAMHLGIGVLEELVELFGMLPAGTQALVISLFAITAALGPIIGLLGLLTPGFTLLARALFGTTLALSTETVVLGANTAALTSNTAALSANVAAQGAAGAAAAGTAVRMGGLIGLFANLGPWGIALAALGVAVFSVIEYFELWDDIAYEANSAIATIVDTAQHLRDLVTEPFVIRVRVVDESGRASEQEKQTSSGGRGGGRFASFDDIYPFPTPSEVGAFIEGLVEQQWMHVESTRASREEQTLFNIALEHYGELLRGLEEQQRRQRGTEVRESQREQLAEQAGAALAAQQQVENFLGVLQLIPEMADGGISALSTLVEGAAAGFLTAGDILSAYVASGKVDLETFEGAADELLLSLQTDLVNAKLALRAGDAEAAATIATLEQQIAVLRDLEMQALATGSGLRELATAAQTGIAIHIGVEGAIAKANEQLGIWEAKNQRAADALDILNTREEERGYLTEQEIAQRDQLNWMLERTDTTYGELSDAVIEATVNEGKMIQELDALNEQYPEAQRNSEAYKQALEEIYAKYDPLINSQNELRESFEKGAELFGTTVRQLIDLFHTLGLLTDEEYIALVGVDDQATPQLETIEGEVAKYEEMNPNTTISADDQVTPTIQSTIIPGINDLVNEPHVVRIRAEIEAAEQQNLMAEFENANPNLDQDMGFTLTISADTEPASRSVEGLAGEISAFVNPSDGPYTAPIAVDTGMAHGPLLTLEGEAHRVAYGPYVITPTVNIQPAIETLGVLRSYLPQSPAEQGPLSEEIDWDYITSGMPDDLRPGLDEGIRILGSLLPFDGPPQSGVLSGPVDWSWLFADIDMAAEDAGERMGDAVVGWFQDIEGLASGDTLREAQEALAELFDLRAILVETGAPQAAIDEVSAQITAKQAEIEAIGRIMGTAVLRGIQQQMAEDEAWDALQEIIRDSFEGLDFSEIGAEGFSIIDIVGPIQEQIRELYALRDAAAELGLTEQAAEYQAEINRLNIQIEIMTQLFGTEAVQAYIRYREELALVEAETQRLAEAQERLRENTVSLIESIAAGGDEAGRAIQDIRAQYEDAEQALKIGELLGLDDEALAELRRRRDEALAIYQRIFHPHLGIGRELLEQGLLDEETLKYLADIGGEWFDAWYDGVFGEGSAEKLRAGWEMITDEQYRILLESKPEEIGEEWVDLVIDGFLAGRLSWQQALELLADDTGRISDDVKLYLYDLMQVYEQDLQRALATGEGIEAAQAAWDYFMQILAMVAEASGMTVDQLLADFERLKQEAEETAEVVREAAGGRTRAGGPPPSGEAPAREQGREPGFDIFLSAVVGFRTTTERLNDVLEDFVGDLDRTKIDEQLSLLQDVYANPELYPDAMLDHVRDGMKAGLDELGLDALANKDYINKLLTDAGLEPLSDEAFLEWGKSWEERLVDASQKQIDAIWATGDNIVEAIRGLPDTQQAVGTMMAMQTDEHGRLVFAPLEAGATVGGQGGGSTITAGFDDRQVETISSAVSDGAEEGITRATPAITRSIERGLSGFAKKL